MSLPTINVSGYNGIINNLTVNGTLTNAGFAPSGNLNVTGNITATGTSTIAGTSTCNGVLNCAGGFQQNGYTLGFFEGYNSSTQTISNSTITPISFNTIVTNTFSSSILTISGSNNTTFTNSSSNTVYLTIGTSVGANSPNAGNITSISVWVSKSSNGRFYFQTASPYTTSSGNLVSACCSGIISLAAGESFNVNIYVQGTLSSYSSGFGSTYQLNMLTIRQLL